MEGEAGAQRHQGVARNRHGSQQRKRDLPDRWRSPCNTDLLGELEEVVRLWIGDVERLAGSARLVLHTELGAPDRGGPCDRSLDALGRGADDPLRLDFASAIGVGWPDIELVRRDATERIDKLGRCEEQLAGACSPGCMEDVRRTDGIDAIIVE